MSFTVLPVATALYLCDYQTTLYSANNKTDFVNAVRVCLTLASTSESVCHCLRRSDEDAGLVHTAESTQQHSRWLR